MSAAGEREVHWHAGVVSRADRERVRGHRGVTVWLTGLSGAGKSTLARRLEEILFELRVEVAVLDGDNVRHGLNRDLGFAPEHRMENIRRVAEVARMLTELGLVVITAFISPYRADRGAARERFEPGDFLEVHLSADLEVCEHRDPKGLYRRARAGHIPEFTGISAPYEAPPSPELSIDTGALSLERSAALVIEHLACGGFLGTRAPAGAALLETSTLENA